MMRNRLNDSSVGSAHDHGNCELCDVLEVRLVVAEADVARLTLRVGYLTDQLDPEHENTVGDCGFCHTEVRDSHVTLGEPPLPYHVECYGHLMARERDEARAFLREVAGSGVDYDNPRLGYLVVQVGRSAWNDIQKLAQP